MTKQDEMGNPSSCLNKAANDEPIFILRAKDPVAIQVIMFWYRLRTLADMDHGLHRMEDVIDQFDDWRDKKGLGRVKPL
jgi:hypothetical protein